MKKKLILLLLLFFPFVVNAKLIVDYEGGLIDSAVQGMGLSVGINEEGYINDKFYIIKMNYDSFYDEEKDKYQEIYTLLLKQVDNEGKIIQEKEIELYDYPNIIRIFNNKILFLGSDEEFNNYLYVMDENLNIESKTKVTTSMYWTFPNFTSETEDYYFFIDIPIKKDTFTPINIEDEILKSKYAEEYRTAVENDNYEESQLVLNKFLKEQYPDTYISDYYEISYEANILSSANSKDAIAVLGYKDDEQNVYPITIYNYKDNVKKEISVNSYFEPNIFIKNEKLYVLRYQENTEDENDITIDEEAYILYEYDLEGNLLNTVKIYSPLNEHERLQSECWESRLLNLKPTINGFIIKTECRQNPNTRSLQPMRINHIVQKYILSYNVTSKTDGNGIIKVKEKFSASEKVLFEIIPNEGYKIDKIVVTDSSGNILTFHENTFTMPSTDVKIEATFIKEEKNPDTSDIAILACIIIIILGSAGTIYSTRKMLWLK